MLLAQASYDFEGILCVVQVLAVGSGKADDKGKQVKPNLSVGDLVLYQRYAGTEFQVLPQFHSGCCMHY